MANKLEQLIEQIKQDPDMSKALTDPVIFAKVFLDITPRWYQAKILRDPRKKKVARWGRRNGKCIYEESTVITTEGPMKVKDLYNLKIKPDILTYDTNSQKIKKTNFYDVLDNGVKPVFKITTKTGRVNYATGNHPYLSINDKGEMDWIEIDNMLVGDRIAVPSTYEDLIPGESFGEEKSRLLGYLIGDGCTSQNFVSFTNTEDNILSDIKSIIDKFGCDLKKTKYGDYDYRIVKREGKYNDIIQFCRDHNLLGKLATEKEVPKVIMSGTKTDIRNFLSAYWDCDGWCSISEKTYDKSQNLPRVEVGIGSSSEKLARGIQHLLLRLGIVSILNEKKVKYKGKYRKSWQVVITDTDNIRKFAEQINLRSSYKKKELEKIFKLANQRNHCNNRYLDTIPKNIWSYIKKVQKEKGLLNREVCGEKKGVRNGARLHTKYSVSREKLSTYADNLKDNYLKKLANNDILWDEVVSIEYIGDKQTYDLTVPETHTFISDDIISHNTFSMILHMVFYAFTNPDSKQLVVAPLGIQVDTIFKEVRKFIDQHPLLRLSLARSTKTPQYIEFGNGSVILGLSAGTSSGSSAKSLRGQGGDWVYMDETDYLSEEDINSIIGTTLENMSEVGIWCSSTPTGARKKFWEWCTYASDSYAITDKEGFLKEKDIDKYEKHIHRENGNGWVEYHYPSWVNPNWNDEMEAELKAMFSAQGYQHEVLAEFGEETTGVFNKKKIDDSKFDYTYEQMRKRGRFLDRITVIGVDWDKYGDSTQIVVSEFDTDENRIRILERVEIPSTEFTFDNAVKKIKQLAEFWKPNKIYLDRGYGEYQVEVLKKKLGDIVKGIAFQSKIEVRDPTDNTIDKKEVKTFMVNQTSIMLERDQLMLSKHDEMIYTQMERYQVVKRSVTGKPIFTSENEHALDAFMLTVLCFNLEYPDVAKLLEKQRIARTMKVVNKNLHGNIDYKIFGKEFERSKAKEDLRDEPEYVKHMKAIEQATKDRKRFSRHATWGNRGHSRRSPGRRSF